MCSRSPCGRGTTEAQEGRQGGQERHTGRLSPELVLLIGSPETTGTGTASSACADGTPQGSSRSFQNSFVIRYSTLDYFRRYLRSPSECPGR